jgi:hypothetical protein
MTLYDRMIERPVTIDQLTQKLVGRPTLREFCEEARRSNYQPTFCGHHNQEEKARLANAFDTNMRQAGSGIRAHRCHFPSLTRQVAEVTGPVGLATAAVLECGIEALEELSGKGS